MRAMNTRSLLGQVLHGAGFALGSLLAVSTQAATPGITGSLPGSTSPPTFNLSAAAMSISQPNGRSVYAWGYGCTGTPAGFLPAMKLTKCPAAQLPGPTLIVNEGDLVTVVLTNNLPPAAGNTSILFPGFQVTPSAVVTANTTAATVPAAAPLTVAVSTNPTFLDKGVMGPLGALTAVPASPAAGQYSVAGGTYTFGDAGISVTINWTTATYSGVPGLLTQEAPSAAACNLPVNKLCNTVTYTFTATTPGTHSYYSGTQGDLQVEMGMYGALIVLPTNVPATCNSGLAASNLAAKGPTGEGDFRLAHAAYDHPATCYDREYLFQFSEMDDNIHTQVEQQVLADKNHCTSPTGCLIIATEPYVPGYFLVNGRSMPDDMDPNYAGMYPNQPYNGNPHMHPGELTLLRIIGQGRWQHPFHEHGNHVRVLARDGNLLLSPPVTVGAVTTTQAAGPLMFTTTTTPGMTMDGIFYWTGKGLNWDVFGHGYAGDTTPCWPDANGYYTVKKDGSSAATEPNYYEWCGDHTKALEKNPTGQVAAGGPMTLPDPGIVSNGAWYGGSPYLGPEAMGRAVGVTPLPPAGTIANSPTGEAGYAYMWHSHNEREITTDNVFPGGMMMMMLVDPRSYPIDETN